MPYLYGYQIFCFILYFNKLVVSKLFMKSTEGLKATELFLYMKNMFEANNLCINQFLNLGPVKFKKIREIDMK